MKIKKSQLIRIIKEEVSKALEVTRPLPVYEAEGESKFTDENGEQWNVDCKSKYAMSCGDGCSAKPFRAFSPDDQKKLGDMCTLSESKSQPQKITRSQLRKLISEAEDTDKGGEKLVNKPVEIIIKKTLRGRSDHVINFFNHLSSHGDVSWDARDLQVALMNIRLNPRVLLKVIFEYIWKLSKSGHAEIKSIEDQLRQAQGFEGLNSAMRRISADSMYWKGQGSPPRSEEHRKDQYSASWGTQNGTQAASEKQ